MKQLENEVKQLLLSWNVHWSLHDTRTPCSSGGCAKRPDFVFHIGKWIIVLECDEHYHRNYEVSCEIGRIGILKDNLKLPLVVIRLNPGLRNYEKLKEVLDKLLESDGSLPVNEFGIHIVYIGYPDERIQELNEYTANLCDMPFPCTIV